MDIISPDLDSFRAAAVGVGGLIKATVCSKILQMFMRKEVSVKVFKKTSKSPSWILKIAQDGLLQLS